MHITQANLNRLFHHITCDEIKLNELLNTHPLLKELLSEPELKQLTAIEGIMTDSTQLHLLRQDGLKKYNDDTYVFKATAPRYHTNNQCPRLQNDWINILIPQKILALGETEKEKYRTFFKPFLVDDSDNIKQQKVQAGAIAVRAYYLSKGIELHESEIYQYTTRQHTQTVSVSNTMNLGQKIDEYRVFLHTIANNQRLQNVYHSRYINNKKIKLLYKNKSEEEKYYIEQMQNFRRELLELSINQLTITHHFNADNLDKQVLDKLGFLPCATCLNQLTFRQNTDTTDIPF